MKGNRARNTNPELSLRRLLREGGFTGYRLHWKRAPGHPDIAYPGRRIAVFVHGCFWHRCPHCNPPLPKSHLDYWERKFELNKERDARKIRDLEAAGWSVFVIWECQLKRDPASAVAPLLDALSDCSRGDSSPRP